MVTNSSKQMNKGKGRTRGSKDKNVRAMHPNSIKNLDKRVLWKPGQQGRHKGMTITQRQQQLMAEDCPFDTQGRDWLESLAEGGMRQALFSPGALNNLQDRHEGKVTQPNDDGRVVQITSFTFILPDGTKLAPKQLKEVETEQDGSVHTTEGL